MKVTPVKLLYLTAVALLLWAFAAAQAAAQAQAPRGGKCEALLAPADAKVLVTP